MLAIGVDGSTVMVTKSEVVVEMTGEAEAASETVTVKV